MAASTIDSATTLRLTRYYSAPRNLVFEALTEPALLAQWFAPTDEMKVVVDRFEAKVGGSYRIEMHARPDTVYTCIGTVQEILPPERLVYTWSWEGGEMPETVVTWELTEAEGGTMLTLTHERFPGEKETAGHEEGWTGAVGRLQRLLTRAGEAFHHLFEVNTRLYRNVLIGVTATEFAARLNERTNSMQWIAGHLALTRGGLAALLGARPDPSMGMFWEGMKQDVVYPGMEEITRAWTSATERLLDRLAAVTWADLARATPPHYAGSEENLRDALAFLAEHESYHIGQLGLLRKAYGYEAVRYD
jgi:uncharacterized protein YndB with AHSA1/START domain/uncharacterized damage-inducible protein DinB